jgi:hypothetical protein
VLWPKREERKNPQLNQEKLLASLLAKQGNLTKGIERPIDAVCFS